MKMNSGTNPVKDNEILCRVFLFSRADVSEVERVEDPDGTE
jgi:hypothetical protein